MVVWALPLPSLLRCRLDDRFVRLPFLVDRGECRYPPRWDSANLTENPLGEHADWGPSSVTSFASVGPMRYCS